MCGIAGIFRFDGKKPSASLLSRMSGSIIHRGPDGHGSFSHGPCSIASRRLAIIDLTGGNQPISTPGGRFTIVYNGEIYNYREVREELMRAGAKFATNSDTEVILLSYAKWGHSCVKKLNGMFAFAIYDKEKNGLFLARDRLGIKPLYYHLDGGRLLFASEIKAILQDESIKRKPNFNALSEYLRFQNVFGQKTFFEGILQLPPGHHATVSKGGMQIRQYWDFEPREDSRISPEAAVGKTRRALLDSVRRHMIADVPVGCYLSGGFDSSSVATLAHSVAGRRIETFSGYFGLPGYDEIDAAREVASSIGSRQNEVKITPQDFLSSFPHLVYHLEEPRVAATSFSHYCVSRLVSSRVKVVLTGHGGDEFFAGYPVFKAFLISETMVRKPAAALGHMAGVKPGEIPRVLYFLFGKHFSPGISYGIFELFSPGMQKGLLAPGAREAVLSHDPTRELSAMLSGKKLSPTQQLSTIYVKTYLPSLFLIEDKVGMAWSIESRTPLCGNEVVSLSESLPMHVKLHRGHLKYLVKEAMRGKLPPSLYQRRKMGFPTPIGRWFRRELRPLLESVFASKRFIERGIFSPREVNRLYSKFLRTPQISQDLELLLSNRLWAILMVEMWFRIFIDPPKLEKPGPLSDYLKQQDSVPVQARH